ncbi:hypothetical protein TWF694_011381 [Orbilia ellipsospora]|uniref:Nucleoside phosphorylase domain-containing protein n=1 Tax=Orbilia ellipsospora TaxID=2528407 RepID=A0AAV9X670_9PEZI
MNAKRPSNEHHDQASSSYPSKRQKSSHGNLNDTPGEPGRGSLVPQHDRYTIAWICALSIEMAAALAMLDNVHETLATYTNNNNTYRLGSIRGHNIVIACLPNAQYGTNNAANVLTNLIRTFPCIRLGLMVGIGGGVPSMADIRLGDVVVGTRVMQYDLGKIGKNGEILRTAVPKTPHPLLNTVVSTLRADHELAQSRIPSILREKLGEHTEYSLPSLPDRLFAATYEHTSSIPSCDGCDESKLVLRRPLSSNPTIHYGIIASGNLVMKNGTIRDHVAWELEALCFEMEAAGLMDILPCLPIRGICDYSDSHKNKGWQKYAAATAAAYARELLEVLPAAETPTRASYVPDPHRVLSDNHQSQLLDSLRYEQIDSRKLTIRAAHAKTCSWFLSHPDYLAWLNPERLAEHHGFLWIRGKPGTGKSTLMKFLYSQTKKRDRSNLIASFFFNARGEQLEKTISGMYRSLLLQLLEGYPILQAVLDPELFPRNQNGCPPLNALRDMFCQAVASLGQQPFTCFIDALDECDEQQVRAMVQDFEDLAEKSTQIGVSFRICFSSRHYPYIIVRRGLKVTLEDQPGHGEDLANYISSHLNIKDDTLSKALLGKAAGVFLWVVLVVDILNRENQRGGLAIKKKLAELPSGLSELFKNMLTRDSENMEDLLLCIIWILCANRPLTAREYYHALWSGLSLKGLSDDEVPDVTGSDSDGIIKRCVISSSKGLAETTKSKHPTVQFIHESVRDFLIKDKGLQQLWPDLGFDWESPSHEILKQCCHTYLNKLPARWLTSEVCEQAEADQELSKYYPFLEYASQNILLHADAAAVTIPQDEFLSKFIVPGWTRVINLFERYKARQYKTPPSLLYIFAEKNLINLIRSYSDGVSWLKVGGGRYGTPLFAALALGNDKVVQTFLELQVQCRPREPLLQSLRKWYSEDKNLRPTFGRGFKLSKSKNFLAALRDQNDVILSVFIIYSGLAGNSDSSLKRQQICLALVNAARSGHETIVRLLLEKNGSIEMVDSNGRTSLSHVAQSGSEAMVQLLLEQNANAESKCGDGRTPLSYAAGSGSKAVVLLLLKRGADMESKDTNGRGPLIHAVIQGRAEITRLLLERGANMESKDRTNGQTPLIHAIIRGQVEIIRLLLERGADMESKDTNGRGPLIHAVIQGHVEVIQLLLERGADTESINRRCIAHGDPNGAREDAISQLMLAAPKCNAGQTLFSFAAEKEDNALAQLVIINERVDPDSRDNDGRTPLSYAAAAERDAVVKLLLINKHVNPDSRDNNGRTPLSYAAGSLWGSTAKLLLADERVNPDSRDNKGRTPLSYAASTSGDIAKLLLADERVNPDSRDNNGRTPLSYAAGSLRDSTAKLLLADERVNPDSRDNKGRTPLSYAAGLLWDSTAKLLLADERVDPDSRDNNGRTPLSYATSTSGDTAKLLLATQKVNPESKCNGGRTPSYYAKASYPRVREELDVARF